jgi:hypothetical protein
VADVLKVLAQLAPSAATLTDCYTVPASTAAVVTLINVCNRSGTASKFRVSIAIAGAVDNVKQYLSYDTTVNGNDSVKVNLGQIALAAGDVVRVYAENATLSFTVAGMEIT